MKKAFLFSILGLVSFLLQAQTNAICQMSPLSKDNSIIRMWEDNGTYYQISYLNGWAEDTYLAFKATSWTYAKVDSLPFDTYINDIQLDSIGAQYSYCCGQNGTTTGFLGYWDNYDFLSASSTLPCHYFNLPPIYGNESITNIIPEKMVCYGANNIAFIGYGDYHNDSSGVTMPIRLIGHALRISSGIWTIDYLMDLEQVEHYDDITLTEQYVVVTSHKNNTIGTFFRLFGKTNTFFDPCADYTYQILNDESDSEVLCTALEHDNFAIAHFCHNDQGNRMLRVGTIELTPSSIPSMPTVIFNNISMVESNLPIPQGTTYRLRDFRHDAVQNRLMVLQEHECGATTTNILANYQLNSSFNIINGYADIYLDGNFFWRIHSMDLYPANQAVISGATSNGMFAYVDYPAWNCPPCFKYDKQYFTKVNPGKYWVWNQKQHQTIRTLEHGYNLNVNIQNINILCK